VVLPRGPHTLQFANVDPSTRQESWGQIQVGSRPSIARHALGRFDALPPSNGPSLLGVVAFTAGAINVVVGSVSLLAGGDVDGADLRATGAITLGTGVLSVLVGWLILRRTRTVIQPGSTTQWTP